MSARPAISVNERAATLVERMIADAAELRIGVTRGEYGETCIDAGSQHAGSIAAGLRMAAICMGGLGEIDLVPSRLTPNWPTGNVCSGCGGRTFTKRGRNGEEARRTVISQAVINSASFVR